MINAKEASEKLATMSPAERLEALKRKISESTRNVLDAKIREIIAAYERQVDITLDEDICRDSSKDIQALLVGLGYTDTSVTSGVLADGESHIGTTTIKFSIPNFPSTSL